MNTWTKRLVLAGAILTLSTPLILTKTQIKANAWGVETKFSKIVSFRDKDGKFLDSKQLSAKPGEVVTITLPEIDGYKRPVEKLDILFDNKDTVIVTYLSENSTTPDFQLPDITNPDAPNLIPSNPKPHTPVKPPVNGLESFKVYSELQDWGGHTLIAEFNPVTLTGLAGEKVAFKAPLPEFGYVLSQAPSQTDFIFGKDTEAKYVFKLRYEPVSQQLVRRVNFTDESGQVLKQAQVDGGTFRGTKDYAQNKYIWETKQINLDEVKAPSIPGYTAIDANIPAASYTALADTLDTQVHEYTIHYVKN